MSQGRDKRAALGADQARRTILNDLVSLIDDFYQHAALIRKETFRNELKWRTGSVEVLSKAQKLPDLSRASS